MKTYLKNLARTFVVNRIRILEDDTFLVSYPRSGNTWMRFLIANLKQPDGELTYQDLNNLVPDLYAQRDLSECIVPRVIKSHEPYNKRYPRVVYVYRDGRDVAISYYFYQKKYHGYDKPFDVFLRDMLSGKVPFGSWQEHVSSWMFREHNAPFHPVKFEDLKKDAAAVLDGVGRFLGLEVDDKGLKEAVRRSALGEHGKVYRNKEHIEKFPGHLKGSDERKKRGSSGQWAEFFGDRLLDEFWEAAGDVMERLGYER